MRQEACRFYLRDAQDDGAWQDPEAERAGFCDIAGLRSLLGVLRDYDERRERLARAGGGAGDFRALSQTLRRGFTVRGPYGEAEAALCNPSEVRKALNRAGQYDVCFEIRRTDFNLPAYYVARTRHDYWNACGLIVEDLYRSAAFAIDDPRFVRIMEFGHSRYYLRLSMLRAQAAAVAENGDGTRQGTDRLLFTLGRYIFAAGWHADQRFSFLVADAFELPELKAAIETSYLCLGADLCALRRHLDDDVRRFLAEGYPNGALAALVAGLSRTSGNRLAALPRKALECYVEVAALFHAFLETEVGWDGLTRRTIPLWKPILGNIGRLRLVAEQLAGRESLCEAKARLELGARKQAQALVECCDEAAVANP